MTGTTTTVGEKRKVAIEPSDTPSAKRPKPQGRTFSKPGPSRKKCVWCSITHGHSCTTNRCAVRHRLGGIGSDELLERCRVLRRYYGEKLRVVLERFGVEGADKLQIKLEAEHGPEVLAAVHAKVSGAGKKKNANGGASGGKKKGGAAPAAAATTAATTTKGGTTTTATVKDRVRAGGVAVEREIPGALELHGQGHQQQMQRHYQQQMLAQQQQHGYMHQMPVTGMAGGGYMHQHPMHHHHHHHHHQMHQQLQHPQPQRTVVSCDLSRLGKKKRVVLQPSQFSDKLDILSRICAEVL